MPWKHDGKVIIEGRSWTSSEGISHPKNWSSAWSDDDKKSLFKFSTSFIFLLT